MQYGWLFNATITNIVYSCQNIYKSSIQLIVYVCQNARFNSNTAFRRTTMILTEMSCARVQTEGHSPHADLYSSTDSQSWFTDNSERLFSPDKSLCRYRGNNIVSTDFIQPPHQLFAIPRQPGNQQCLSGNRGNIWNGTVFVLRRGVADCSVLARTLASCFYRRRFPEGSGEGEISLNMPCQTWSTPVLSFQSRWRAGS